MRDSLFVELWVEIPLLCNWGASFVRIAIETTRRFVGPSGLPSYATYNDNMSGGWVDGWVEDRGVREGKREDKKE